LHAELPGHPAAFYPPGWPSSLSFCSTRAFSRSSLSSILRSKDRLGPATNLSQHAQEGGAHAHPAGFRPCACAHFSAWLSKRDVNSNCSYTTSRIHGKPMGPAASHRVSDYPCLAPSPSRAMVWLGTPITDPKQHWPQPLVIRYVSPKYKGTCLQSR
jgi:hypothetical protein